MRQHEKFYKKQVDVEEILAILDKITNVFIFEILEEQNFTGEYIIVPKSLLKEVGINKDEVKITYGNGKIEIF